MGEDQRPSRRNIFLSRNMSSCAAEHFHSDASVEAVDRRAQIISKTWQWLTEGDDPPHGKPLTGCVCNGLMSTEPGKLIDTKLSFQMNHTSICWIMMAAFVLDAMPMNAAFQSVLSNDVED
ncbi:uncharacterized protein TNCV_4749781 [Trichonephila clavipes]|nr:uncharacterized protein TNCV_4749781 [Trichonephila clavipes]